MKLRYTTFLFLPLLLVLDLGGWRWRRCEAGTAAAAAASTTTTSPRWYQRRPRTPAAPSPSDEGDNDKDQMDDDEAEDDEPDEEEEGKITKPKWLQRLNRTQQATTSNQNEEDTTTTSRPPRRKRALRPMFGSGRRTNTTGTDDSSTKEDNNRESNKETKESSSSEKATTSNDDSETTNRKETTKESSSGDEDDGSTTTLQQQELDSSSSESIIESSSDVVSSQPPQESSSLPQDIGKRVRGWFGSRESMPKEQKEGEEEGAGSSSRSSETSSPESTKEAKPGWFGSKQSRTSEEGEDEEEGDEAVPNERFDQTSKQQEDKLELASPESTLRDHGGRTQEEDVLTQTTKDTAEEVTTDSPASGGQEKSVVPDSSTDEKQERKTKRGWFFRSGVDSPAREEEPEQTGDKSKAETLPPESETKAVEVPVSEDAKEEPSPSTVDSGPIKTIEEQQEETTTDTETAKTGKSSEEGTKQGVSSADMETKEPQESTESKQSDAKEDETKKPAKRGWNIRFGKSPKEETKEGQDEKTDASSSTTIKESPEPSPTSNTTAPDATEKNQTAPVAPQQQQPMQQQPMPQQQGVIVMGAPPSYRYYRGRPQQVPPMQQQQQPGQRPPQQNPNSVIIVEVLGSLVAMASRLWFLTWLTRRMANYEESMHPTQHFVWERLNDKFNRDKVALRTAMSKPPAGVSKGAWRRRHAWKVLGKAPRDRRQLSQMYTRTVVVIELGFGESSSSSSMSRSVDMEHMSDVITFLLQQQRQHAFGTHKLLGHPLELEIVFLVNSPGGAVSTFGLAAAQMQRLQNQPHITTTVCVDKYAASGGYMIATQSDKLLAAPFATVGSVGVILEGLNFHELARRYGVQPLVLKAGNSKNPLTTWGPVSRQDMQQEQERLGKVHEAFKDLVVRGRPALAERLPQVTDGSIYLGEEAKALGLIDAVMTGEEYIMERIEAGDRVLRLHRSLQVRFPRSFRLSPLDILPHLQSRVSKLLVRCKGNQETASFLLQTGTWIGFLHHLLRTYGPNS